MRCGAPYDLSAARDKKELSVPNYETKPENDSNTKLDERNYTGIDKQTEQPPLNDAKVSVARTVTRDGELNQKSLKADNESSSSSTKTVLIRSQRVWLLGITSLLVVTAIMLVSVYFNHHQPEQLLQKQLTQQATSHDPVLPKQAKPSTAAIESTERDALLKSVDAKSHTLTGIDATEAVPSALPGSSDKRAFKVEAPTLPLSQTPAIAATARKSHQAPQAMKECSQAVATLGFCDSGIQQGKQ